MIKLIIKYLFNGIAWGSVWFIVIGIIYDTFSPEVMQGLMENFTIHAVGSIIIGIGSATTPIVYEFDRLRRWLQVAIHAGVGLGTYFTVAFTLGWLPMASSAAIVFSVVSGVMVFFAIWTGFYLYGKHEAKKINEKLKERG
jgi:hypothetical protein